MEELTFNEKLAVRLLKDNITYHYAGLQNEVLDGEMEKDEFEKLFTVSEMDVIATRFLSRSMEKNQVLDSPYTNTVLETKHLKFLGSKRLELIRAFAVAQALGGFEKFI